MIHALFDFVEHTPFMCAWGVVIGMQSHLFPLNLHKFKSNAIIYLTNFVSIIIMGKCIMVSDWIIDFFTAL